MFDVNVDALADAHYAGTSPEFYEGEDEPETPLDEDLDALGNLVHDALMLAHRIKDTHRIRRVNGVIAALTETEEQIDKLERGTH